MQTPPETAAMQSRIWALEEKLAVGIRVPGGFPGPHPEPKAACSLSGDGAAAQQGGQAVPEPPALRSASELGHGSEDNAIGDYCTMCAPVPRGGSKGSTDCQLTELLNVSSAPGPHG